MYEMIVERLRAGEQVRLSPTGQSMTPRIKSGDEITLKPLARDVEKGDIVLAKVRGRYYIHLVSAVEGERVQISNNHGHVNGWTNRTKVYGIVEA